MKETKA